MEPETTWRGFGLCGCGYVTTSVSTVTANGVCDKGGLSVYAKNRMGCVQEYDVSGYLGHSEKLSSPEEVIASGRGVCCGYASLCMQMCR